MDTKTDTYYDKATGEYYLIQHLEWAIVAVSGPHLKLSEANAYTWKKSREAIDEFYAFKSREWVA